jgi:dihydrofolate reductase
MEAIIATDIKGGIAKNNSIPWKSKLDLAFFCEKTNNNVVVMGKTTFQSLPSSKRPLPNRLNIVFTKNPTQFEEYQYCNNVIITSNLELPFEFLDQNNKTEYCKKYPFLKSNYKVFVIGGKQIYSHFWKYCKTIWMTTINKDYFCDLFLNMNDIANNSKEIVFENDELTIAKIKN